MHVDLSKKQMKTMLIKSFSIDTFGPPQTIRDLIWMCIDKCNHIFHQHSKRSNLNNTDEKVMNAMISIKVEV